MVKRILFLAYGVAAYTFFLATFLYTIAFIGGFGVPTRLDGPMRGSLAASLLVDLGLLALFAVQHSVMARRSFKERWTKIVPPALERSTFVLFSSAALALLCWQWRPLGGTVWSVEQPAWRAVLWVLFAWGWLQVLATTFLINHFDLFGLRQVWLYARGREYERVHFATPAPYRMVRHPLYLGFLIAFWSAPEMTVTHLLFAVMTTGYILVGIQFEERDLLREHGSPYDDYRRSVPMLFPVIFRSPGRGKKTADPVTS